MRDSIDEVVEQWGDSVPDIEVSAAAAMGRIHRISRIVQLRSDEILRQAGLSRGEFDVLAVISRHGRPMAPTEIATALAASPAGTTKRVHKLLASGLTERKPHAQDGRSFFLDLTPSAREQVPGLLQSITRMELGVIGAVGKDSLAGLDSALRLLLTRLEASEGE